MKKQAIIAIIGLPGAGKTTLSKSLAALGLTVIEGGEVARDLAKVDHDVSLALSKGEMAPREKMNAAMREVIYNAVLTGETVVIDGYPRYKDQYIDLSGLTFPSSQLYFIVVGSNDAVSTARLLARDQGRIDDTPEAIANRVKNYWIETYPVLELLAEQHADHTVHVPIGTPQDALNYVAGYLKQQGIIEWAPHEI